MQLAITHGVDGFPAGTCCDTFGAELLATPRADDDVRIACNHRVAIGENPRLGQWLARQLGEHIHAAGNFHQLGAPLNAGDDRFVPFFHVDTRPLRQQRRLRSDGVQSALQFVGIGIGTFGHAHQTTQTTDVIQNAGHAAMVGDPHFHTVAYQLRRDIGLDIGEANRQIRLQLQNLAHLGTGERADLGFVATRLRWAHGEAADADDAILLAQRVQRFSRFFGQADNATRADHGAANSVVSTNTAGVFQG
ncbi:hypothetical protein D3C71_1389610 [compost metagenome]